MSDSATTKAFALKSVPRMDNFKSRYPAPVVHPSSSAPSSAINDNFLERINIDNKNSVSQGNSATIDFQGNMLPIFMAICYYVSSFYDNLDFKNHSKLSPPTMAACLLNMYYSFYLLCDLKLRTTPSIHTNFLNTPEFLDYTGFLLNMPIPDFMLKFLLACAPTSDPRRPNIMITPSYACYSFTHDFGRYIPSRLLLVCHNFILKHKTNDIADTLLNKMMQEHVMSFDSQEYFVAHYFGQQVKAGSYNNQLFQALESIINPALARARSAKNVFSHVYDDVYETTAADFNPYQYLLGIDSYNASEQRTFMESILSSIGSKLGKTTPLGSIISSLSGTSILIHSYADHAIPTWHGSKKLTKSDAPKQLRPEDYAKDIYFKVKPDTSDGYETGYPTDSKVNWHSALYPFAKQDETDSYPSDSDLALVTKANQKSAARPVLRVLDPYDYNSTTFKTVFLNGAMLESTSLDGSAVPLPDANLTLDADNSLFLQSAIPLYNIHRAIRFADDNSTGAYWTEIRRNDPDERQKAASFFGDLTINLLPHFDHHLAASETSVTWPLPGYVVQAGMRFMKAAYNRFGFYVPASRNDERPLPDNVEAHSVLVWSPYRYYAGPINTDREKVTFMITNLRTIYGTNPPLGEVAHYLDALPIY